MSKASARRAVRKLKARIEEWQAIINKSGFNKPGSQNVKK